MTKCNFNRLLSENVQFCLSLKCLVDSGADLLKYPQLFEDLCDRSDALLKEHNLKEFITS